MAQRARLVVPLAAELTTVAAVVSGLILASVGALAESNASKVGAVSQQEYSGAVAQMLGGLERAIHFGNDVFAKDTVRTSDSGSTELQFLDDAKLHIGSNASVQLDQYDYDAASGSGSGVLDLFVGAYDFVSGKMHTDDKVKLVTPTVTIGLRGTAFHVYVAGDGRTDIAVTAGLLSLAPCHGGKVSELAAGQSASVAPNCSVTVTSNPRSFPKPTYRRDPLHDQGGQGYGGSSSSSGSSS